MSVKFVKSNPQAPVFVNTVDDAFTPEIWAQEGLAVLENNLVAANLVHRDYENTVATFGDTVNARVPTAFTAARKGVNDDVTDQAVVATKVPVVLNQHLHTSFVVKDGEESKGIGSIIGDYMIPAAQSLAEAIDQIVIAQKYQFLANSVGALGTTPTRATLAALEAKMNILRLPGAGRNLILSPTAKASLLNIDNFVAVDQSGSPAALRNASLGTLFGINTFMDQNCTTIAVGNTIVTGAINNVAGYPAGTAGSMTVDTFVGDAVEAGDWVSIAGVPYQVTATVGGATTTTGITVAGGLRFAVANDAVVVAYTQGAKNGTIAAGDYAAQVVSGFTVAPQKGQLISFGVAANYYGALNVPTTTSIVLDRPQEAIVTASDAVGIGPAGDYSFGFHKNAIALVTRPLALPNRGTGATGAVVNYNGLSMRVVMTYDGKAQGHRVTVDMLAGVKVLDSRLGVLMYG